MQPQQIQGLEWLCARTTNTILDNFVWLMSSASLTVKTESGLWTTLVSTMAPATDNTIGGHQKVTTLNSFYQFTKKNSLMVPLTMYLQARCYLQTPTTSCKVSQFVTTWQVNSSPFHTTWQMSTYCSILMPPTVTLTYQGGINKLNGAQNRWPTR